MEQFEDLEPLDAQGELDAAEVERCLASGAGLGAEDDDLGDLLGSPGRTPPQGAGGEVEDPDSDTERQALQAASVAPEPGEAPPVAQPSALDLAAASSVSDLGYVTCSTPPWASISMIGRITEWPKDVPAPNRSTSCKCYLHKNCSSPAVKRRLATNDQLLQWLYSGPPIPDNATAEQKRQMAAEHKAMWKTLFKAPVATRPDAAPQPMTIAVSSSSSGRI